MKSDTIMIIALGVGGLLVINGLSKGKLASNVVSSSISGVGTGIVEGVLIKPKEWAEKQDYIPIIDEIAFSGATILKKIGNFWNPGKYVTYKDKYKGLFS